MPVRAPDTAEVREAVRRVLVEDPILAMLGLHHHHVLVDPPGTPAPATGHFLVLTWDDAAGRREAGLVQELHVAAHRAGREVDNSVGSALLDRVEQAFTEHRPDSDSPVRHILAVGRRTDGQPAGPRTVVAVFDVMARLRLVAPPDGT